MVFSVPDATLQEYADQLYSSFGLKVSLSTISKFFDANDISRKKVLGTLLF